MGLEGINADWPVTCCGLAGPKRVATATTGNGSKDTMHKQQRQQETLKSAGNGQTWSGAARGTYNCKLPLIECKQL